MVSYRRTPRVKAFCVGQAKSGTASLVGLLSANYRAAQHEPERAATLDLILRHAHGELSDTAIREHLRERDARLDLEYDVAWANQFLTRHLLGVFPAAKFIVLIRDCYTWLQSIMGHLAVRDVPDDVVAKLSSRTGKRAACWSGGGIAASGDSARTPSQAHGRSVRRDPSHAEPLRLGRERTARGSLRTT